MEKAQNTICESRPFDPKVALLLKLEGEVKRDLDYMRDLLTRLEESDDWQHDLGFTDEPDDESVLDYHVRLLEDEGFLLMLQPGVYRMTSKAHDFLDHTRDKDIWEKSKQAVAHLKDHSISMVVSVAEGYVRQKIIEYTGLSI